ncbi:MAG: hypothetical protein M5R36_02385 [Deltaproteobacteria bacterium]|nr:hypothetical protein [Deltaproteobacteria bacterium]
MVWVSDARLPLYAAQQFHRRGQLKEALLLYNYAYGRDAQNVSTALALAEVLLLLDDDKELVNIYLNAAGELPRSPSQDDRLRWLMIAWGLVTGRSDFFIRR